jgi:hypothetical protein
LATHSTTPTHQLPSPPPDVDEASPAELDAVTRCLEDHTQALLVLLAETPQSWGASAHEQRRLTQHLARRQAKAFGAAAAGVVTRPAAASTALHGGAP